MRFGILGAVIYLSLLARATRAEENLLRPEVIRTTVARAIPLLEKGAAGHRDHRTCFSCHNQGLPILALTTAKLRGFAVSDAELHKHRDFILEYLGDNRADYIEGVGQVGQVNTAGYALWALEGLGHKRDQTTAAIVEYLLQYQKDLDHWRPTTNRPPSEVSPFTTTYLAIRGLRSWGTPEQQGRIDARIEQVRGWLRKAEAENTEDRVFRLWALKLADATDGDIQQAVSDIVTTQLDSGGWEQMKRMGPDAYATGSALVALHEAGGMATSDAVYQRAMRFLLESQQDDGSWHVKTRSRPFQSYFETGFPHGKDQFISAAASAWAILAVALACPER
jgi:hypothetical protein